MYILIFILGFFVITLSKHNLEGRKRILGFAFGTFYILFGFIIGSLSFSLSLYNNILFILYREVATAC